MPTYHVHANFMTEFALAAGRVYRDPYEDVDVDVVFAGPGGRRARVPAFWAGGQTWRIRFAPPAVGKWTYETVCTNADDPGLHGQSGGVVAQEFGGDRANPLLRHGRLRVASDRRHLEMTDGTPFFWLGDTWWMGLCARIDWPLGYQKLVFDRVAKGFTVVQMVAGPYPDMDAWDPRGRSLAGFPFAAGFERINPEYYDMADLKIGYLVRNGLVPCIVGMWGYYLPQIGIERVKRYWRYLVARYGAYPVVWCMAGEATMPYYLSETREADSKLQRAGWTEVARYVQQIDGFDNPITIHPGRFAHDEVEDPSALDIDMLQTGHGDRESVLNNAASVTAAVAHEPRMPVVVGEVNYEGIMGRCWEDVQRMCFWTSILNGAAGHTYGANGIWQASTADEPYGASPHGHAWGNTPWQEAYHLPGSSQLGPARRLLERYPWWQMRTHNEWVEPAWDGREVYRPTAAGIPRELRIIYAPMVWDAPLVKGIEADVEYDALYFDPRSGEEISLGRVKPSADGTWRAPVPPEMHDWVIVMTA